MNGKIKENIQEKIENKSIYIAKNTLEFAFKLLDYQKIERFINMMKSLILTLITD